jgi:opacity protein-like surface antigen
MRKSLFFALLFAFVLPFTAPKAQAQFVLTPYLGYNIEDGFGFLVGIGGEFVAPFEISNLDLSIAPSVEYVFTEDFDGGGFVDDVSTSYIQVNGDVIAKFAPSGSIAPFAGAGLAYGIFSAESNGFDASSSDIGLNLLGGVTFPDALGFGDPYVQGRLTLIDGSAISIIGGVRIPLGQN